MRALHNGNKNAVVCRQVLNTTMLMTLLEAKDVPCRTFEAICKVKHILSVTLASLSNDSCPSA